jgi:hypothetical protein
MVFETLNARGLELTASDLIKNYLMASVAKRGQGDLRHILNKWIRITQSIGAQRLPEFIRHYANSVGPFVRQERLFRHIREQVKSPAEALEIVRQLEQAAVCYRALWDAEDEFWHDYPNAADHVRVLVMFGVSQFKPLILAATRRLGPTDLHTVLRDCVTVSLRFNLVSRLGTHELEKRYNEAAVAIEMGHAQTPSAIRDVLRPVYVDDEQFKNDFEILRVSFTSKGKQLIRYLLCSLERQHSNSDLSWHAMDASIEHILPESPSENWSSLFSDEEHARWADRLGNYALLETSKNRDLEQKPFSEKKGVLRSSQFRLTQAVADYNEWDKSCISARQRKLASIALGIWKFPQ